MSKLAKIGTLNHYFPNCMHKQTSFTFVFLKHNKFNAMELKKGFSIPTILRRDVKLVAKYLYDFITQVYSTNMGIFPMRATLDMCFRRWRALGSCFCLACISKLGKHFPNSSMGSTHGLVFALEVRARVAMGAITPYQACD